jgi:hypothetical protein
VGGRIGVEHSFAGKTRGKGPRPRAIARASGREKAAAAAAAARRVQFAPRGRRGGHRRRR